MGASSTFLLSAPNLKPVFVWIWGKEKMHVAGRRLKGTTIWVLCVEESIHKEHFGFLLVPRTEGLQWPLATPRPLRWSKYPKSIGSMYGIYANIWGILMVNVSIYTIHGSYGKSIVASSYSHEIATTVLRAVGWEICCEVRWVLGPQLYRLCCHSRLDPFDGH